MSTYPSVPWSSDQGSFAWKSWFQRLQNYLQDGIYTPVLTNVTNLDSSSANTCQFLRIGDTVLVSGGVNVDATATGNCELGISLPPNIGSKFTAIQDCAGMGHIDGHDEQGVIVADITNDRASLKWVAVDLTDNSWVFIFTYRVIG